MVKHPINDGHPAVPPHHNALLQPRPGVPRGTNGLLSDVASWLGNPRTKWRWFMGKTSITMRFSNATFDYRRVPAKSEDSSHENSVLALFSLLWRHFRTKISSVQSGRFECFSSVFWVYHLKDQDGSWDPHIIFCNSMYPRLRKRLFNDFGFGWWLFSQFWGSRKKSLDPYPNRSQPWPSWNPVHTHPPAGDQTRLPANCG